MLQRLLAEPHNILRCECPLCFVVAVPSQLAPNPPKIHGSGTLAGTGEYGLVVCSLSSSCTGDLDYIGRDAKFICLHDSEGVTKPLLSATHITAGAYTVPLESLNIVYGRPKCYGCLMSLREGNSRLFMCTSPGKKGHTSASSAAHQLPRESGPNHEKSWSKVMAHAASLEEEMEDFTEKVLGKKAKGAWKTGEKKKDDKKSKKAKR